MDVMKDMVNAPYFSITLPSGHPLYSTQDAATKGLPLTDDQVAAVRECVYRNLDEAAITAWANSNEGDSNYPFASWSTGMKELKYHMLHGAETYYETAYIFRRSKYGAKDSQIGEAFTNINTVATVDPAWGTPMGLLVNSLTPGEWLKRPSSVENYAPGKWRITEEYQWALKWSVVYGGTWNMP